MFWSFWLAISEPGWTSPQKVPLGVRLKSTKPSEIQERPRGKFPWGEIQNDDVGCVVVLLLLVVVAWWFAGLPGGLLLCCSAACCFNSAPTQLQRSSNAAHTQLATQLARSSHAAYTQLATQLTRSSHAARNAAYTQLTRSSQRSFNTRCINPPLRFCKGGGVM